MRLKSSAGRISVHGNLEDDKTLYRELTLPTPQGGTPSESHLTREKVDSHTPDQAPDATNEQHKPELLREDGP